MERRRTKRLSAKRAVVEFSRVSLLDVLRKPDWERFLLVNFGTGGVQFLATMPLEKGLRSRVNVILPGASRPVEARGVVVWNSKVEKRELYLVGLAFTKIKKDDADRLARFMEEAEILGRY